MILLFYTMICSGFRWLKWLDRSKIGPLVERIIANPVPTLLLTSYVSLIIVCLLTLLNTLRLLLGFMTLSALVNTILLQRLLLAVCPVILLALLRGPLAVGGLALPPLKMGGIPLLSLLMALPQSCCFRYFYLGYLSFAFY